MSLTLVIGPMKSSKSLELLARAEPYRYADKKVLYLKPFRDVRSHTIKSRLGMEAEAKESDMLPRSIEEDVIAIDEIHMYPPNQVRRIAELLDNGKIVICAGLNTDHAGRLMPTIARLLELSPDILINKQAVCEVCGGAATHTQVMNPDGTVIDKQMPPEVPDDGTYRYEARCRNCFE